MPLNRLPRILRNQGRLLETSRRVRPERVNKWPNCVLAAAAAADDDDDTAEADKPQMKIWRMRTAYWITKATNTHSEYVILLAFPLQQWSRERASYIICTLPVLFKYAK